MTQSAAFREIADKFTNLTDWEDQYRYIIELGQALPQLAAYERVEANRVRGCASQVWLVLDVDDRKGQGNLTYRGESDAMIVQGLVAVVLALYSGRPAREIAETNAIAVFDKMGLRQHLTTQRSNGLSAMVSRIRADGRFRSAQL